MSVLAMLCLAMNKANAQGNAGGITGDLMDIRNLKEKLFVQDWLDKKVPLGLFTNYVQKTASLNDFKDKMVILGFWFTSCSACLREFPNELDLQEKFDNEIQIILITYQPASEIDPFLQAWEARNGRRFTLPVIVSDTLLRQAFHRYYNPSYVWILPNGKIAGQSTQQMINAKTIQGLLEDYRNSNE